MFDGFIGFVRQLYGSDDFIPLHAPVFSGNEKKYVNQAIDSTFVSSVSDFVGRFEDQICDLTVASYAVATINGTAALHVALHALGVKQGEEVITQAFSFIGTTNAISYCGAVPVFLDISEHTLGLDAVQLEQFLTQHAERRDEGAFHLPSGKRLGACVPMHTFGHPLEIARVSDICRAWGIPLIEDAAEAVGSYVGGRHCGTWGDCGILSFNGNKVVTTGGGGAVITDDAALATRIRHLTTTAKVNHRWQFQHDELGFNYRLPGLNAALGCAQFESLPAYLADKREIAEAYGRWVQEQVDDQGISCVTEPANAHSNYWLNAFEMQSRQQRDEFLQATNNAGVMTRPPWNLLCDLPMYRGAPRADDLPVSREKADRLVNIPSGMRSE